MQIKLDMIGIITENFSAMRDFYRDVLEMKIKLEMENFVEFESPGTRLAISTNAIMFQATGQVEFKEKKSGHSFELAFLIDSPEAVDEAYKTLIEKGAKGVKAPETMPWNQRTAFFSDPDGNIHEIFANL